MNFTRNRKVHEWLVTAPSLLWLIVLFLIPTLIVFAIAFKPADLYGGIGAGWTLETLRSLGNPSYPVIIWRTLYLSLMTTAACIILATPAGYCMARANRRWRQILMLLVIVPFWTSFLIRIFAWKTLLHPEGLIKKAFVFLHMLRPEASLLYNAWAVWLVMVYTFLPFAILPIYAAAEKFDFRLLEAAQDLGARQWQSFAYVFLPGIRRGLWTAILVVFIPALGSYVIPDIVGGTNGEMLGNKIAQRVFVDRNLPHASGLSALLILAVLLPLLRNLGGQPQALNFIRISASTSFILSLFQGSFIPPIIPGVRNKRSPPATLLMPLRGQTLSYRAWSLESSARGASEE